MIDQNMQSLLLGKIAAYTEILVKDPSSTIFVSLAETYRKMGMFDDARQIISKGLSLHPDFGPAQIVLGRVLCQLDDYDGSVAAFECALDLDPDSLAALVGYARVQILLGDEVSARNLLLRARKLSPADPVINKLLLSLPEELSEESDSEETPVDDSGESASAPLLSSTLADLYFEQGLPEKALDIYQQLSRQNPDDLSLRRRLKEVEEQLAGGSNESVDVDLAESKDEMSSDKVTDLDELSSDNDDGPQKVLETLNCWLSNIKERRGNV